MAISRKIRFEVFKRDKFTCQYCGRSAPEIVLNVDHIDPVSLGGSDHILNLITSCFECNQGKKATPLDDHTVVAKQKAQLDLLQERREQLEMVLEWQKGLLSLEEDILARVTWYFSERTHGVQLSETGRQKLRKLLQRFSVEEVLTAIRESSTQHLRFKDDEPTSESALEVFNKISMYCVLARKAAEQPHIKQLYYIRGILRKRLRWVNERELMDLLDHAVRSGLDPGWLTHQAKHVGSYSRFKTVIFEAIESSSMEA